MLLRKTRVSTRLLTVVPNIAQVFQFTVWNFPINYVYCRVWKKKLICFWFYIIKNQGIGDFLILLFSNLRLKVPALSHYPQTTVDYKRIRSLVWIGCDTTKLFDSKINNTQIIVGDTLIQHSFHLDAGEGSYNRSFNFVQKTKTCEHLAQI